MPGVSQGLVEFANHFRLPAAPGIEVIETARYRITLQPDYPIPGPNSAAWIRCAQDEAGSMIDEVRAIVAPRRLPLMWILDPETEPPGFDEVLAARGVHPDPTAPGVAVMVLPADTHIESPNYPGLDIRDALASTADFQAADLVNAEAFGDPQRGTTASDVAAQERRRLNQLAAGNRHVLLATVDGEAAGSSGLTVFAPAGAIITGGAVRPKFRGRGIYRAMVAARLDIARRAGVEGLQVWGGPMSAPILERMGFVKVGWRRFYPDRTTA
jgi:GNAT superfamily N-acetyltransferase